VHSARTIVTSSCDAILLSYDAGRLLNSAAVE